MGKPKKKGKSKIDFDALLEGTADPGWMTGVPASGAMDEDGPAAGATAAAADVQMAGMSAPAPVADFVSMDTGDARPKQQHIPQGKRGNRSAKQKLRRATAQEKASARAERVKSKELKRQGKQNVKGVLKHIY